MSTIPDERGREYGLGSLRPIYGSGKRKGGPGSSSATTFEELQEQLAAAQRQIEEQAAANTRRDVEASLREAKAKRLAKAQQSRINDLELLLGYLKEKDLAFDAYMKANVPQPQPTTPETSELETKELPTSSPMQDQ